MGRKQASSLVHHETSSTSNRGQSRLFIRKAFLQSCVLLLLLCHHETSSACNRLGWLGLLTLGTGRSRLENSAVVGGSTSFLGRSSNSSRNRLFLGGAGGEHRGRGLGHAQMSGKGSGQVRAVEALFSNDFGAIKSQELFVRLALNLVNGLKHLASVLGAVLVLAHDHIFQTHDIVRCHVESHHVNHLHIGQLHALWFGASVVQLNHGTLCFFGNDFLLSDESLEHLDKVHLEAFEVFLAVP
mmetsp:Transcript_15938/g.34949  ORF Transcript_15938/g.34949 Transcript_15938/m.34949 type:complete len:242 (+) Transcript_15938:362-1087(+)